MNWMKNSFYSVSVRCEGHNSVCRLSNGQPGKPTQWHNVKHINIIGNGKKISEWDFPRISCVTFTCVQKFGATFFSTFIISLFPE